MTDGAAAVPIAVLYRPAVTAMFPQHPDVCSRISVVLRDTGRDLIPAIGSDPALEAIFLPESFFEPHEVAVVPNLGQPGGPRSRGGAGLWIEPTDIGAGKQRIESQSGLELVLTVCS